MHTDTAVVTTATPTAPTVERESTTPEGKRLQLHATNPASTLMQYQQEGGKFGAYIECLMEQN